MWARISAAVFSSEPRIGELGHSFAARWQFMLGSPFEVGNSGLRSARSARCARTRAAPTEHSRIPATSANESSWSRERSRTSRSPRSSRPRARCRRAWSSLLAADSSARRRLVRVGLEARGVRRDRAGGGPAEMVHRAAPREVVHPRGEAALVAVGVAVLEHPLEDDLGDVLRRGPVAGQLGEVAEERSVVALEELPHAVEVAVAHGEHELVVGGGGFGFQGGAPVPVNPERLGKHRVFGGGAIHGMGGGAARNSGMPLQPSAGPIVTGLFAATRVLIGANGSPRQLSCSAIPQ